MTNEVEPEVVYNFKDRRRGLLVFGIVELAIAAYLIFMTPIYLILIRFIGLVYGVAPSSKDYASLPILFLTGSAEAAWFICLGIGTIYSRRWARSLSLATAWLLLLGGTWGLIKVLFHLAATSSAMLRGNSGLGPFNVFMELVSLSMNLLYVIVPGVLIFFYGSRDVKATCEQYDPRNRWTDRLSLVILISIVFLGQLATMILCAAIKEAF